jgi:hypothetical protein
MGNRTGKMENGKWKVTTREHNDSRNYRDDRRSIRCEKK